MSRPEFNPRDDEVMEQCDNMLRVDGCTIRCHKWVGHEGEHEASWEWEDVPAPAGESAAAMSERMAKIVYSIMMRPNRSEVELLLLEYYINEWLRRRGGTNHV
jgi:hypothetical protein